MIAAGGDEIAQQVRQQLISLRDEVSGAVADAVALSMIAGAAAAFRELSPDAPQVQTERLQAAVRASTPVAH